MAKPQSPKPPKDSRVDIKPVKPPKDDLQLPSVFVDQSKLQAIKDQMAKADPKNLAAMSDHVLRAVIHLAALGISDAAIAKNLGLPRQRVQVWTRSESIKREIEKAQTEHFQRDCAQMFGRMVPQAVQTIFDLMVSKKSKETTKTEIAKYIVDRAHGKAREQVDHKIDLISQVFASLTDPQAGASQPKTIEGIFKEVNSVDESEQSDQLEQILKG